MIYLDHHAATPLVRAARDAMGVAMADGWANASSIHTAGRRSRAILERARDAVAGALSVASADVVLTSGGTEAISLALLGLRPRPTRVVTTAIEHPAVLVAAERLAGLGVELVVLPVVEGVAPDASIVAERLDGGTVLAVGLVNHETGTALPVAAWGAACARAGARLVVDATQALGKIPVHAGELFASALAVGASKIGGPSGAGALFVARGIELEPLFSGGAQERGRRPGALDVLAHAGMAGALAELPARLAAMPDVARHRDELERGLVGLGATVNATLAPRVATALSVSVPGWRGEALVAALDLEGLCVSSGAACSSGVGAPSAVLRAMYPDEPWRAESALRLTLGPDTTASEVTSALEILARVLPRAFK